MARRHLPEAHDPHFPSWDAIHANVKWEGWWGVRDLRGADWSDRTGDHRQRSLDPLFNPKPPLKPWGER
jgi:hypothetical protein